MDVRQTSLLFFPHPREQLSFVACRSIGSNLRGPMKLAPPFPSLSVECCGKPWIDSATDRS
jgi:hypothetical protein